MKDEIYNIIVRPLVTEKGTWQSSALNAYPFEVDPRAKKTQRCQTVEKIYEVKVKTVRTARQKGKPRRTGRVMSQTRDWKKAVVVLHDDYHIDLF